MGRHIRVVVGREAELQQVRQQTPVVVAAYHRGRQGKSTINRCGWFGLEGRAWAGAGGVRTSSVHRQAQVDTRHQPTSSGETALLWFGI